MFTIFYHGKIFIYFVTCFWTTSEFQNSHKINHSDSFYTSRFNLSNIIHVSSKDISQTDLNKINIYFIAFDFQQYLITSLKPSTTAGERF